MNEAQMDARASSVDVQQCSGIDATFATLRLPNATHMCLPRADQMKKQQANATGGRFRRWARKALNPNQRSIAAFRRVWEQNAQLTNELG